MGPAAAHRSRAMQAFITSQRPWLVAERLPAYAPELNPVEGLWASIKQTGGNVAVAFTAAERERITGILLDTGHRLFTTQGLRKTSLAELVAPAGIAPSSFYAFFAAKEALYLELMLRHAPEIAGQLTDALARRPARAALVAVMRTTVRLLEHDPLYRRLLTHPDELAAVGRRLGPDELRRVEPHLLHPLVRFIQHARAAGELVAATPTAVVGVLRTVGLLVLHRSDYGDAYHEVLDLTIEGLADGLTLTTCPDPHPAPGPDPGPRRSAAR